MNEQPIIDMKEQTKIIAGVSATVFLIGAYLGLSPLVLSNFLLYLPTKVEDYSAIPLQTFGAKEEPVTFSAPSGNTLHGFFFDKPGARYTVLIHQGQGGNLVTHFGLAKTTGDFSEALAALLGNDAPGLSASTVSRLKDVQ